MQEKKLPAGSWHNQNICCLDRFRGQKVKGGFCPLIILENRSDHERPERFYADKK